MTKTTIEFSDDAAEKLAELSKQLHTSKASIVRNALGLYVYIVREFARKVGSTEGPNLALVDSDGEVSKIIVIPGLQNTQRTR